MKLSVHLLFLSLLVIAFDADAQQHAVPEQRHDYSVFQQIERGYEKGQLSLDQKVLLKYHAVHEPKKLPPDYQIEQTAPFKCGNPAILDFQRNRSKLSPSTIAEIKSVTSPQTNASESYTSSSGHFEIHYETSGEHAVPPGDSNNNGTPDYVEKVAAAADSSYRHMVQTLGYTNPIPSGESYNIEIRNLKHIYGETLAPSHFANPYDNTLIRIENDFSEDFPPNDHPEGDRIGAVNATVSHEFKHAIQYTASQWSGETGNWLEMDATLMEEVVYDNVNDYYNYIQSDESIFNNPQQSFYPGSYYHVTWALFFEEKYGSQFWVDVWEIIKQDPSGTTMIGALTQQLGGPEAYRRAYAESQLWHYASGPENSTADYGFEESASYPSPEIEYKSVGDNALAMPDTLRFLSATYFDIQSSPFDGTIALNLSKSPNLETAFAVLGYLEDGSVEPLFITNQQKSINYETDWQWDEISKIGIVAANGIDQQNSEYKLAVQSVDPQTVQVEQNYPNPFNDQTTIRFSLTEQSSVKLEIFDTLGRKVATLIDGTRPRGIYQERFDGSNYASGVYFFRLNVDGDITTKQMTLVK